MHVLLDVNGDNIFDDDSFTGVYDDLGFLIAVNFDGAFGPCFSCG